MYAWRKQTSNVWKGIEHFVVYLGIESWHYDSPIKLDGHHFHRLKITCSVLHGKDVWDITLKGNFLILKVNVEKGETTLQ